MLRIFLLLSEALEIGTFGALCIFGLDVDSKLGFAFLELSGTRNNTAHQGSDRIPEFETDSQDRELGVEFGAR